MASDSLLSVIAGLVKREGRIAREENKKAKEALKAEQEKDEEDEDEDPVGDGKSDAKAAEKEPEPKDKEEPEDDGEGDTKPTGPDPTLVAQVAAIVKQEIEDEEKEKKETELKLTGKKEKIDTKPSIKQEGKMNFREAVRASVTGTTLTEGYESVVLGILEDEGIKGPLGYEPFFEKGKLFVMKGQQKTTEKALKNSREVSKVPKIVGEELEADEYLAMEAVDVDGRCRGFKEALKRLTYEKIKAMKAKEEARTEEVEVDESLELQAIMALDDAGIQADISKKGEVVVKKKDMKKAEAALKKSFAKGKMPKLVGEEVEVEEGADKDTKGDKEAYQKFFKAALKKFGVDEPDQLKGDKKKEFFDYIDKGWKADNEKPEPGDKKEEVTLGDVLDKIVEDAEQDELDEKKVKMKKIRGGKIIKKVTTDKKSTKMVGGKEVRMTPGEQRKRKIGGKKGAKKKRGQMAAIQRKTKKSLKKRGTLGMDYLPGGRMIETWKQAAFDKIRSIRSRLGEGIDATAARELKLYIENDRDLYRKQIVPIIKNVQRRMKSGKYDHAQAPKLWMYLVDEGAKKYVKDFGGNVKDMFPKDLRLSIANEFANEYKAEIEIQGGEMV